MKRFTCTAMSLAALSACAPLQQAPLVYSSKSVFGLDISATTTETPGASFAFGWKSVDAAYVPVAVARTCEGAQVNCSSDSYRLIQIGGGYREANINGSDDTRSLQTQYLQQFKQAQVVAETAKLAQDTAANALKKATQDVLEETRRLDVLEAKPADTRSGEERKLLDEGMLRLTLLKGIETERQAAFDAAKQTAEDRASAVKEFDPKRISEATAGTSRADARANTDKADAYSVFGSFDANTKSEISTSAPKQDSPGQVKIEPTLVLGKVFSTGVASQNLTEGMHKYYAAMAFTRTAQAISDCVASASKVAETVKGNEEIVKAAFEACRAIDRMQQYKPADDKLRQAAASQ